jgi:diguanylate cyclase (GGDEF)-like protein
MSQTAAFSNKTADRASPYVGRLADRLISSVNRNGVIIDNNSHALIEELFGFATEAEKQLLDQENMISRLEELCATDVLTGLTNRRGLDKFLEKAISRARRFGQHGIIGFFDLDGFKHINDGLGHGAGDAVLKHVASVLNKNIRGCDLAARYGGDEFVVVLDGTDLEFGKERLKRVQKIINDTPFSHDGMAITLHTSLGISTFGANSIFEDILATADRQMYLQKQTNSKVSRH